MYENLLAGLDIFTITSAFVGASLQEAFIADVEGNSGVSFANDRGNLFSNAPDPQWDLGSDRRQSVLSLDWVTSLEPALELAQFPFSFSGVAVGVDEGTETMLLASLPSSLVDLLVSPIEFTVALLDFLDVLSDVFLAVGPNVGSLAVDSTVGPVALITLAVFPDHFSLAIISAVCKVANIAIAVGLSVGSLTMSEVLLEVAGVLVTVLGDFTTLALFDTVSPVSFIDVFVDDADLAGARTLVPETLEQSAVAGH